MCLCYIIQHHSQPLGLDFFFRFGSVRFGSVRFGSVRVGSGRVGSGFLNEKPRAADHVYSKGIYMVLPKEKGPEGPDPHSHSTA
jgi:hypothetical protein